MISLSSEMTDAKGRRARAGWVFFDGQCSFCLTWVRRFGPFLEPRGFALAPLQDPRVQVLLGLPPEQLLLEMRVLTPEGRQYGGADAFIFLARHVWWGWPLYALAKVPGMRGILRAGYRWVAARRQCASAACVPGKGGVTAGQFRDGGSRK